MQDQHSTASIERWRRGQTPVDLRQFRYVVAAAEHHSFRRAGAFLNIHPSAISRRVHDLETRLGTLLFRRTSAGVEITREGQQLLDRARPALEALYAAADTIATGGSRMLRVGVSSSVSPHVLYGLLDEFKARHPTVKETILEGDTHDHLASVRSRRLDVAIVAGLAAPPPCRLTPLWNEDIFAILPAGHPLTAHPTIEAQDALACHPSISQDEPADEIIEAVASAVGAAVAPMPIERRAIGRLAMMTRVSLGHGMALCGEATTRIAFPGIALRPLARFSCPLAFSAISLADNNKMALRRFLGIARAFSPSPQDLDERIACSSRSGLIR